MKAVVQWREKVRFVAKSGTGHSVSLDGPAEYGGQNKGARPMELILMGMGGCAAFDVVHILQKARQNVQDCVCEVQAQRSDDVPKVFTKIQLHFILFGDGLSEHQVAKAVKLSAEKYCSASIMLGKAAEISHSFVINTLKKSPNFREKPTHAGLRHVALKAENIANMEKFYVDLLGFTVEWRPDEDNLYLSSGADNLAIHKVQKVEKNKGALDHIGVVVNEPSEVDHWYEFLLSHDIKMASQPKTHRDGARSFYCYDPEDNVLQVIFHPPIS